jgi:hypothetical protein
MDGRLRIAAELLRQLLLAGMLSVQAVPPRLRVRTTSRGWWSGPFSMERPLAWATPLLVVPAAGRAGPAAAQLAWGHDDRARRAAVAAQPG